MHRDREPIRWSGLFFLLLAAHCSLLAPLGCGRKSSLLLQRQARGPILEEPGIAQGITWILEPTTQTQAQGSVEVAVTHASPEFLGEFFSHQEVFGEFAGRIPYFPEQLVFYVKITNRSGKKIRLDPVNFALTDDRGNQYHVLSTDLTTALAEAKAPVSTLTRGILQDARPGYFGVSLPVGKLFAGKPQRRFALLAMATLEAGYLYDGVTYDGLVAFWNPHQEAKRLALLLANVETDFDAGDLPHTALEFAFDFTAGLRPK